MLSGLLDLIGGSSEKKSYEELVLPIVQHGRTLTHVDCFSWLDQKAVVLMKEHDHPQVGTVRYVGTNDKGVLCAGIEFEYNIGGMSGKVHGQKLFKCKSGHGLLVPVEYVRLLSDYEDGSNIFPASRRAQRQEPSVSRTQSVPNMSQSRGQSGSGMTSSQSCTIPFEDFHAVFLPTISIGDNVVWLGGTSPQTGIVKWIGTVRSDTRNIVKVWVEMDDYLGYGKDEIDLGTRFGCAVGRGKLFPADELILLSNYLAEETPTTWSPESLECNLPLSSNDQQHAFHLPVYPDPPPRQATVHPISEAMEASPIVTGDLIDFSDLSGTKDEDANLNVTEEGTSLADKDFRNVMAPEEEEPVTPDDNNALSRDTSVFDEFVATAPPPPMEEDNPPSYGWATSQQSQEVSEEPTENQSQEGIDVNGNSETSSIHPGAKVLDSKLASLKLVDPNSEDFLPPFLVPQINIVEFFRAEGLKGIQGRRNSCYLDVCLFAMFAFTEDFDQYFLSRDTPYTKVSDSILTKTAKKALADIVNQLRQNYYCPASTVNTLRDLMIPFSDKLDGAFMDIDELMIIMFDKLFQLKDFITYDNGLKDYVHQVNLGDHLLPPVMTVKQALEMSFQNYNLKLQSVPSPAFIVTIPRHHAGIVQATTIVPNLTLNMGDFLTEKDGAYSTRMNLSAVICINDFHFVTFVKSGKGLLSHWVLFDSNPSEERPKVEVVTNMGECLESLEHQALTDPSKVTEKKHKLPPQVQRLLSDIYVCIYTKD